MSTLCTSYIKLKTLIKKYIQIIKFMLLNIFSKALIKAYRVMTVFSNKKDNENKKEINIKVDRLLSRNPINLDCNSCINYISGKTVLVTGGGGTIGSELCRQISKYEPGNLIILDHYENNIYILQQELIRIYGSKLNIEVEIASIQDFHKMDKIFSNKKIDIVFHAAAYKHVPLMEKNPEEAIKNNIISTYNTAILADKHNVDKFVLISTDKAVNPTSVMGATKRICELIIQSYDKKSKTDFVAVRFGNVLGSSGSVIPLFIDQIHHGGPITVTHEDITRYFMTIPEAVNLVLMAFTIAKGGEIFVLDMGKPIKIKDLANRLIELYSLRPDIDIRIVYTGLRPGEKLHEELIVTDNINQIKTEIDKIFIEHPIEIDDKELNDCIELLKTASEEMDLETELCLLEKLVPKYKRTPNDQKENNYLLKE